MTQRVVAGVYTPARTARRDVRAQTARDHPSGQFEDLAQGGRGKEKERTQSVVLSDAFPGSKTEEREFCIDNLLVRIHFVIVKIR